MYEPVFSLELDAKSFAKKLALLHRVNRVLQTLPILNQFLVTAVNGEATAIASNLDVHVSVPLGATMPKRAAFVLPPQALPLVARCPSEKIGITLFERKTKTSLPAIAGGKRVENVERQVQVGPVRFETLDPKEFPPCKDLSPDLPRKAAAAFTGFSPLIRTVSTDPIRQNLSGVYFRLCQYEMVATDGHRLHLVRIAKELSGAGDSLVPPLALRLMESACPKGEEIRIDFYQQGSDRVPQVFVGHAGEFTVAGRCIEGEFPDYRQVIPGGPLPNAALVDRKEMIQALGQAMAILDHARSGVALEVGDEKLRVVANNVEAKGAFELPCQATRGQGASLGFKARYLVDALEAAASEKVTLEWTDEASPLRLEDGDFLAVIMPMRL